MAWMQHWPVWALALSIFGMRVIDVSVGTLRTIAVVNGWIRLSVVLGFFEVLVWLTAVAQAISRVGEHPVLMLAFAGGFATGNAVGILLERRLALGTCVVRMISMGHGTDIAERLRGLGHTVTTFEGRGKDGPRLLLYVSCARRRLARILATAQGIDPQLFFTVEPVSRMSPLAPLPSATGWRAILKKK